MCRCRQPDITPSRPSLFEFSKCHSAHRRKTARLAQKKMGKGGGCLRRAKWWSLPQFFSIQESYRDRQKLRTTQICQQESRPSLPHLKAGRSPLGSAPVRKRYLLTQAPSKHSSTRHLKGTKVKLDSAIFTNAKATRLVNVKPLVTKHSKNVRTLF